MTITLFFVMAIEAVIATVPPVMFIPRARQSPMFDRILWIATWALAFLSAWYAPSLIAADSPLNSFVLGDAPIIPTMAGAIVGALLLNGLLFVMDRFSGQAAEEDEEVIAEPAGNEPKVENGETIQEPIASEQAEAKTDAPSEV